MTKIIEKSIVEQMADLLKDEPQHCDVVFFVGPEKIKVKAVKFVLKAASPVFRKEFKENWETATMKEGDGIPMPDVDPAAFELFIHLIISDKWSVDALKSLGLSIAATLNLLTLCRRFEITKGIKSLDKAFDHLLQDFNTFKDTQEFLKLSRKQLETILSCDGIPLDEIEVFECACRWAEHQCKEKKIEATDENCREVLGTCFFEIRFPTMELDIFFRLSCSQHRLFTAEDLNEIMKFIQLNNEQKAEYDRTQLPFKTIPRSRGNSFGWSVLRLPTQFKVTANPPFECDGILRRILFKVNNDILLRGIGFLGPINEDTQYDVTVQIRVDEGTYERETRKVLARKGEVFYFLFNRNHPIALLPRLDGIPWKNCEIHYSLKGGNSVSRYKADHPKDVSVQMSGIEFNLSSSWSDQPVAELLYKKLFYSKAFGA